MTSAFSLGAVPVDEGRTRFTVWAPKRQRVALSFPDNGRVFELSDQGGGYHGAIVDDCGPGARYHFLLDGEGPFADPASRAQPDGVHGPSQVLDLRAHRWQDAAHRPRPLWQHVISEVHIGTWTPAGTFDSAVAALDQLVEVGISAVEVMPVAQFPGRRNWGYDGVFPFAVQNSYGGAAGLQRFVDACHQRGLDVILDVVYNHLGPEGNILGAFGPYFTDRYRTPWGPAVNFDGADSNDVRAYFLYNVRQWFTEFHIDGLRLDAVHEIIDRSAVPFLSDLAGVAADSSGRFLVAESADNNPRIVTPISAGGIGMDAQWNDDFHHALHAAITGERTGYYLDFGPVNDIARAMDEGFVYQGEYSQFRHLDHGGPSGAIAPERFVVFAQNHDHIGNRPKGDRLVTLVTLEQAQLAAALVLLAPGVPLLFMGEEYGDPAPFPYFIDHGDPDLVEAVRAGRAREFAAFAESGGVLDADAQATFDAAHLDPSLRHHGAHRCQWDLHRALIELRRTYSSLQRSPRAGARAFASANVVTLIRSNADGAVAALFNVSPDTVEAVVPPPPLGWSGSEAAEAGPDERAAEQCWSKVLDARTAAFGGHGELLPEFVAPGDRPRLGPWEFCAYRLAANRGGT
jgi:maltooligosyltrehalose trehalohydrolase